MRSVLKATCWGSPERLQDRWSDVQRHPDGPVRGSHHLAADESSGSSHLHGHRGVQPQHAGVEQHRLVELLPALHQVHMINPSRLHGA